MSVYRYTIGTPRFIRCVRCGASERIWSDQQIARWKVAHTAAHDGGQTLERRLP